MQWYGNITNCSLKRKKKTFTSGPVKSEEFEN